MDKAKYANLDDLVIIGLGNEFISDDGVGIRALRILEDIMHAGGECRGITFEERAVGGLPLLDCLMGHEQCIVIDAIVTGVRPPGTLYRFHSTSSGIPTQLTTSHQTDLSQILRLARILNQRSPQAVTVYGIEASDVTTFRTECTEPVERAIPQLAEIIYDDLNSGLVPRSGTPRDEISTELDVIMAAPTTEPL